MLIPDMSHTLTACGPWANTTRKFLTLGTFHWIGDLIANTEQFDYQRKPITAN